MSRWRSRILTTIIILAVLSTLTIGVAASPDGDQQGSERAAQSTGQTPTHAVRGVVKSINSESLVIIDSGKARREMTFQLSPSTYREGELALGATVSVRYRLEGNLLKATAVSTHPEKNRTARGPEAAR
jgi:hypothetical protein